MVSVALAGVAVLDFVFAMDEMPRTAEKFRAKDAYISGGGNAANAAVAIARLGAKASLAARLGDDQIADMIIAGLIEEGVDTSPIKRFENKRSSFSSIYIDAQGERQIMNFRDNDLSMNADWLAAALPENFDVALADSRWPDGAAELMAHARRQNVAGVIDAEAPAHESIEAIKTASHVAFSAQGARDFTGRTDIDQATLDAAKTIDGNVIVTDGANGAFTVESGKLRNHPAYRVTAVDTLGAGDTWHGAFAVMLAESKCQDTAIRFANAAAALKCVKAGGRDSAPTRQDVKTFMETN